MYMAVTTVTTVGFREVNELSDAGRVFTMLYVLTGVGAAFYILTALVAVIIEGDLGEIFGVRRYRVAIRQLENHYIICGYGRVGREVAQELTARKVPFVVVDFNPDIQQQAKRDNVLMINSDATEADVLMEAGIQRCRGLIAASDSDANNTYITLTAKSLRADVFVVARVGSPEVGPNCVRPAPTAWSRPTRSAAAGWRWPRCSRSSPTSSTSLLTLRRAGGCSLRSS